MDLNSQNSTTVAIVQSNYIPWKGYFDFINSVDEFILYDDVQFTKRDWRNRNKIKTKEGLKWLTIPVAVKGKYLQKIRDTCISDARWMEQHWAIIQHSYAKAPYFREYKHWLENLYLTCTHQYLSKVNHHFIRAICDLLEIKTRIRWSSDFQLVDGKNERLIGLCKQAGADHYLSGPTAQSYIDESQFAQEGITVSYMKYEPYPEYLQLFPPFDHAVSIIDLILNMGPESSEYYRKGKDNGRG